MKLPNKNEPNGIKPRLVVVGNGMVSHRFCERLVDYEVNDAWDTVVYGEEPRAAYDRVHLTNYFETRSAEPLMLGTSEWYEASGIMLQTSARVAQVDPDRHTLTLEDGTEAPFDALVFATGSSAFVPPISGADLPGVYVYRTIEDLERLIADSETAESAVVIGGGLLGLEAARATQELGLRTTVIERSPSLMARQLDATAGEILCERIREMGIDVVCDEGVTAMVAGSDGRVSEVTLGSGKSLQTNIVVIAAGIRARDELADGILVKKGGRGGILVDDRMQTTCRDIYAIGEVASHREMTYGLVGPGYQMADVLARNLAGETAAFEGADTSTRLKLMGVEVSSLGDPITEADNLRAVRFEDRSRGIYRKLTFDTNTRAIVGAVLVGDNELFPQLQSYINLGIELPERPEQLVAPTPEGAGGGAANGIEALPDAAQVCSCENVSKGDVVTAISCGANSIGAIKSKTCAGTGCGGCIPLVTRLLKRELALAGVEENDHICEHFAYSRRELFEIVKVRKVHSFDELISDYGTGYGCETCKPAVASILSSLWNDHIVNHQNIQDTNDRFLANIQKGGSYSVIPRIPAGELTPTQLMTIGEVASEYSLYTKITGGQRIALFGAHVSELPDIWEKLMAVGLESGHAYGKALRTVKSCVGTDWCRVAVGDSCGLAVKLENRYRGLRSPHKLKMGASGCMRECAEARGKDVGVIASDKGWNLYVGGNGGTTPRHAELLLPDLSEDEVINIVDRFLMYYIHTAPKLTRTSTWIDSYEGGLDAIRDVIVNDSLGICEQLELDMARNLDAFRCEWAEVVNNPEKRATFTAFANDASDDPSMQFTTKRGQVRPAPRPEPEIDAHTERLNLLEIVQPKPALDWVDAVAASEIKRDSSVAVRIGDVQLAIFRMRDGDTYFASQNLCPHKREMVLSQGLISSRGEIPAVACPMHKRLYSLIDGKRVDAEGEGIRTFPVRVEDGRVLVQVPSLEVLEADGDLTGMCERALACSGAAE